MAARPRGGSGKSGRGVVETAGLAAKPGPEPSLSLDRIVATAVELLDADGLDGLKMRRLADRLGAGAMSLYWHVDNKEKVLDLALDAVLAQRAYHSVEDWREDIIRMLEDWRSCMLRHSWSASLLPLRALGPNLMNRLERLGAALSRGGVKDAELNVAIWSLWNFTMGATITRASFTRTDDTQTSGNEATLSDTAHPTLYRTRLLSDDDWDGVFRRGLDFLLDGFAGQPGRI